MDKMSQRKISIAILNTLQSAGRPLGATRIAKRIEDFGFVLSQRTVRYYLQKMDREGLTHNFGKKGRKITAQGESELKTAFVIDKVGFVSAKIDTLTYQMNFLYKKLKGDVIINISSIEKEYFPKALQQIQLVYKAALGMGTLVALGSPGEKIGTIAIEENRVGIGTVCSVTLNGILLKEGIHATSRFGGLLELVNGHPFRFTEIIAYDGSSIDPLEIFIKGGMTSVRQAAITGNGKIGASFREIPSIAVSKVEKIKNRMHKIGLGGILMIGKPGRPLLDIPVTEGRVGMIVAGGLNPIAAVEESGIATENTAMKGLLPFEKLLPYWEITA
jgi:hypothetical protein